MLDIRRLDDRISVAPQIAADDVATLKAQGFTDLINNRPDDEEPGQTNGRAIHAAADATGLAYAEVPVTHAGFSHAQLDAMAAALDAATGPVLAYCRSGTRSCNLWALTRARAGDDPDMLTATAAAAGYDLSGVRPLMDALAGRR